MWFPVILALVNIFALGGFFIYGEGRIQDNIANVREEIVKVREKERTMYDIKLDIEKTVIAKEANDEFLRILAAKCRPEGKFMIHAKETGEVRYYTCKEIRGNNA